MIIGCVYPNSRADNQKDSHFLPFWDFGPKIIFGTQGSQDHKDLIKKQSLLES